jgi:hypothetical protein
MDNCQDKISWRYLSILQSSSISDDSFWYCQVWSSYHGPSTSGGKSCQKIGLSPNSCGIHGLRNLLWPEVQVHEGLPPRPRPQELLGSMPQASWGDQLNRALQRHKHVKKHLWTSLGIKQKQHFSKDLVAMSFPKHHPSRKPVRWHLYVRQLWPHHRWTAPGAMLKLARTCWANTPIWGYLWISIVTHLVFSCWFMNQFRAYDCLWVCYHAVMNHWRG